MSTQIYHPPATAPPTLRKLNEKIAYHKARKRSRPAPAGRQPTRCPDCEETWIGLPRRGACPRCGFVYDENTRAWSGRRGARLGTPIVVSLAAIGAAVMYHETLWAVLSAAILLPVYWAWAVYDYLVARDGRFIATTPTGVVCRIRSHKTRTIPWERVAFAEATAYRMPMFKVATKNRAERIRVHRAIRNCRDGCEFAAAVEDGIRRYGARGAADQRQ